MTTEGAAPQACRCTELRIAHWARSRGAAFYLPGIYASRATFFRCVCACAGAVRVGPSVCQSCLHACCLCVPPAGQGIRVGLS
eukprot:5356198-Prymnesium_polylepis.1